MTTVNEEQTNDIQEAFQHHAFVSLPTGVDGTHRVYRIYDNPGVVCCDFLLYRTSNGRGKALRNEATLLHQNISQLHAQLQSHPPPLSPPIYCHAITFLGKKAYVLANEYGQLVSIRLMPLLIIDSEPRMNTQHDLTSIPPTHVVPISSFNQYLANNYSKRNQYSSQFNKPFNQLRKSYRFLGLALILLPLLLGLSGVFWGLGFSLLAILMLLVGILGPVFLSRKALKAFHQFQHQHTISISHPRLITNTYSDPIDSPIETQSQNEIPPEPLPEVLTPQTPWTPTTTATFLQDSMYSALKSSLATYQTGNWRGFSEHIRAFLIHGLRLFLLKQTRQTTENLSQILTLIPKEETRQTLSGWLQRLATTRQNHPLSPNEAQQIMNFTIHLLRHQHAIPPTWEVQVFQVIPRIANVKPPVTTIPTTSSTDIRTSIVPDQPAQIQENESPPIPELVAPTGSTDHGAPLRVLSKNELAMLNDLVRSGASPFLLVFANRYVSSWTTLKGLVDEVATKLGSQINVILFPGLGDAERNSDILEYYQRFRLEGASDPPPLPFLCLLSRQLLLHVTEDNIPIPQELIINANPEGLLDRVQATLRIAQTYQIELSSEDNNLTERTLDTIPNTSPTLDTTPHHDIPLEPVSSSSSLIAETDDVIEEVASVPRNNAIRQVTKVDLVTAQERRELASLVPIALAVVELPEHQALIDALEAAVIEEPNLIAQFVDGTAHPDASEILNLPGGSVRLRFNGSERILTNPKAAHLIANIRQLRAVQTISQAQNQV